MDSLTHDGHKAMTIARWPLASGAKKNAPAKASFLKLFQTSIFEPDLSTKDKVLLQGIHMLSMKALTYHSKVMANIKSFLCQADTAKTICPKSIDAGWHIELVTSFFRFITILSYLSDKFQHHQSNNVSKCLTLYQTIQGFQFPRLIKWCFTTLSTVIQSYHGSSSNYSCLSWISPVLCWGSEFQYPTKGF